jgi:hypothetical protein
VGPHVVERNTKTLEPSEYTREPSSESGSERGAGTSDEDSGKRGCCGGGVRGSGSGGGAAEGEATEDDAGAGADGSLALSSEISERTGLDLFSVAVTARGDASPPTRADPPAVSAAARALPATAVATNATDRSLVTNGVSRPETDAFFSSSMDVVARDARSDRARFTSAIARAMARSS